jgi:hypothetical protein
MMQGDIKYRWAKFTPDNEFNEDELFYLKADCRLTAEQKREGWDVRRVVICAEEEFNLGRIY